MAEISQKYKYVKLDDGVSFSLVRTNPKLTTNTKLMYNGKKMYMESYASGELLNRSMYKNVSVKPNSTFNKDIASFLAGTGSQAYSVYQNFSDSTISDSYDNQFETFYWCGAEYIDSYFYDEEIGFVAPLYLREKLPNYFVIFRLDTPSNYNLVVDENGKVTDSVFDFKTDILEKAVLIKTFDLREGSVLGNYIHNYVNQEGFEFDKSMYVNFSNAEVTYYGINRIDGVFEKKVESFGNELLRNDRPLLKNDEWFTEGFERNGLIFPYIMNIEYLFDDDNFIHNGEESYDFARYIGVYCNNIEFGEFATLSELENYGYTEDNAIYYFEDNKKNLHRYSNNGGFKIDGKNAELFNESLISGFEKDKIVVFAEPLDVNEGFINRAQYGFEILKPFEPGDWVGIEYNDHVECFFADNKNINAGIKYDMAIGEFSDYRFSVSKNSSVNDIAKALANAVNRNKKSKFEASCSDNIVSFYAKREGKEFNGSVTGGAKILLDASLLYNRKISMPISNNLTLVNGNEHPVENISNSDNVIHAAEFGDSDGEIIRYEKSSFGNYYKDYFCGACDADINFKTEVHKNVFKINSDESVFFDIGRYLKTNNGSGRRICANMVYINSEGIIDPNYRLIIIDDLPYDKKNNSGYDISVSSTFQVEIMDPIKSNHGILSWFPVKDFDFDMNYSSYGQYAAFAEECKKLSDKIVYTMNGDVADDENSSELNLLQEFNNSIKSEIKKLAKAPLIDGFDNNLETEYDYYLEQYLPELCLISKTTPYISKWGYFDEQKDSCENPYRLNVSKAFGISNLSANTFLKKCNETEHTHSMPYYMSLGAIDYLKNYQYILTDDIYGAYSDAVKSEQYTMSKNDTDVFTTFNNCVEYWVNMFMDTHKDWFSYFFSGKKYGKRFDRKYSRLSGGDKMHNPSTLFRGVKFEAVRQYGGVEKRTSEYNDYKFSFVYIPVIIKSMVFKSTVYFIKNDTFKFIVGIIFVNTMLGAHEHNIFDGKIDYFNKGFLYAACKNAIRAQGSGKYNYNLSLVYSNPNMDNKTVISSNEFWKNKIGKSLYMWISVDGKTVIVSTSNEDIQKEDIIGTFSVWGAESDSDSDTNDGGIDNITKFNQNSISTVKKINDKELEIYKNQYVEEYDTKIYECIKYTYYGNVECKLSDIYMYFNNNTLVDVCDIKWDYFDEETLSGYKVDVSNLLFKSESLQNILLNLGDDNTVVAVRIYNTDRGGEAGVDITFYNIIFENNNIYIPDQNTYIVNSVINIDDVVGSLMIKVLKNTDDSNLNLDDDNINTFATMLEVTGVNGEKIENLKIDIVIKDKFDEHSESLALKKYFSVFDQVSAYSISNSINNNFNVKYYSTNEDNKYKIRVVEPDSIEIEDKFEAIPVIITQNNKSVDSVEIRKKQDTDKVGIKVINRYSGYYNPIFNDILYYDDYTYSKTVGRLVENMYELPYSNTHIDYDYSDGYGSFGVIRNMYYHKTNVTRSDNILTFENPVYPAKNEYALDYRDYNVFSSSWDDGYFISQEDLNNISICSGIGSMKDGLCMFGSKYLNLPDYIFIDTFENGRIWDEKMVIDNRDNTNVELMYKEVDSRTVEYHLFLEKRLIRYLAESLYGVFSKYINKEYSFGDKSTIMDDVEEYVEKNLLKLYAINRIYLYIKDEKMKINDKNIENEYLKYMDVANEDKIRLGFPVVSVSGGGIMMKDSVFRMSKTNEFDRNIVYNLKSGFKESFGFGVSFIRK